MKTKDTLRGWLLLALLFNIVAIQAQTDTAYVYEEDYYEEEEASSLANIFDINLLVGQGQGLFDTYLDGPKYGLSATMFWQKGEGEPSFFGVRWQYQHIRSFSHKYSDGSQGYPIEFDSRTSSNMMALAGVYRFFLPWRVWRIEPYLEASAGVRGLYTFTSTVAVDDEDAGGDFGYEKFAVSPLFGAGLGLMAPIAADYYITARVSYEGGLSTTFWAPRPLPARVTSSYDAFVERTAPPNLLQYEVGMAYLF